MCVEFWKSRGHHGRQRDRYSECSAECSHEQLYISSWWPSVSFYLFLFLHTCVVFIFPKKRSLGRSDAKASSDTNIQTIFWAFYTKQLGRFDADTPFGINVRISFCSIRHIHRSDNEWAWSKRQNNPWLLVSGAGQFEYSGNGFSKATNAACLLDVRCVVYLRQWIPRRSLSKSKSSRNWFGPHSTNCDCNTFFNLAVVGDFLFPTFWNIVFYWKRNYPH